MVAAASLVVSQLEEYVPVSELESQISENDLPQFQPELKKLASQSPPLIRLAGDHFTITARGLEVALRHRQMALEPADLHPVPEPQPLRHKGSHNQAMREYAAEVGGSFDPSVGKRCNFCRHEEARFVKKGGKRLCQVCFGEGKRPWT